MNRRSPSFKNWKPVSSTSSRVKARTRATGTTHERLLRRTLWRMGLRFRKNVRQLPGVPDIVFSRARVVVFCDGDFWHGRNWADRREKLRTGGNSKYWIRKIKANMARDLWHNKKLEKLGWKVLRFWESDILENDTRIAEIIIQFVRFDEY